MTSLLLFEHLGGITNKEEIVEKYKLHDLFWVPEYIPNSELNLICLNANEGDYVLITTVSNHTYESVVHEEYIETASKIMTSDGVMFKNKRIKALENQGFIKDGYNYIRLPTQNQGFIKDGYDYIRLPTKNKLRIYTMSQKYELEPITCGEIEERLQKRDADGYVTDKIKGQIIAKIGDDPRYESKTYRWTLNQEPDTVVYIARFLSQHAIVEPP